MGAEVDLPRCARRGFRGNCRPWAARITCAFRRAPRVPFRTDEKEPKVRLRTLRRVLRNLREYLARTRGLPPLPTGTPAEGSIQVAGAPNDGNNGAASLPGRGTRGRVADPPPVRRTRIGLTDRGVSCGQEPQLTCALRSQRPRPDGSHNPRRKTTPVPGVRAPCARARRSRAVFRLPVGDASEIKTAAPPLWELPVRFRRLAGRGVAPAARRLAGCCRLVRSSVAGRRRLCPKANRRRRGGQGGMAPCGFFPPFLVRTRNGAARRGGTRQASPLDVRTI